MINIFEANKKIGIANKEIEYLSEISKYKKKNQIKIL